MFLPFFESLRNSGVPVTMREYLAFLDGVSQGLVTYDIEGFYYLARAAMVKDERNLDKFDVAFGQAFKGMNQITGMDVLDAIDLPPEWFEKMARRHLSDQERAEIEAAGGLEALMQALRERLAEQQGAHFGGNKWIGTGGTSPFGADGENPEGLRIGQDEAGNGSAVKIWDQREFRNFDDTVELGTRNIKVALRRLRRWARDGAADELDLDGTIRATAQHGYLDVQTRPERRNAVKVLLLLDVGGSMDPYVRVVEELFSAARAEFKHLESYYFHNCLYDMVWRDNQRRWDDQTPTAELMRTYGGDYKCIFVGDATMAPTEITMRGASGEHWNAEPGSVWLQRARQTWPANIWINPTPKQYWHQSHSIGVINDIFDKRMVPMTLEGIAEGMKLLLR
ncbi:MAG: VWA domain-containing protein [Paracoccaceae bacterium]